MGLEIVDSLSRLSVLQPEWLRLYDRTPSATPFQHPCWLLTWWSHFGGGRLHVLIYREQERVSGILPCFLHEWEGRRQLTLLGTGVSDYLDLLADGVSGQAFVQALQRHLRTYTEWDLCKWQDLPAATPLQSLHTCAAFETAASEDVPCSEIPLTGTFDELWQSRSKDMRRNLRRYSQRAREMGSVEFEISSGADTEMLDALVHLHTIRWQKQGEPGMIQANGSEAFLREIAARFAALGMTRLFAIRFKRKIVAVVLTFRFRNRIFSYMSAFDPEYEILGFGRMLLYEAIQDSYRQGLEAWNFLRGEEPYKVSWGAHPIPKRRVILQRNIAD